MKVKKLFLSSCHFDGMLSGLGCALYDFIIQFSGLGWSPLETFPRSLMKNFDSVGTSATVILCHHFIGEFMKVIAGDFYNVKDSVTNISNSSPKLTVSIIGVV